MAVLPVRVNLLKLRKIETEKGVSLKGRPIEEHNFRINRPYFVGRTLGTDVSRFLDDVTIGKLGSHVGDYSKVSVPLSKLGFANIPEVQGAFVLQDSHEVELPSLTFYDFSTSRRLILVPSKNYPGMQRVDLFEKTHHVPLHLGDSLILPYAKDGNYFALKVLPSDRKEF